MLRRRLVLWSTVGALLGSAAASAQSLGDIARKEAERRRGIKNPSKIYTTDDLKRYGASPAGDQTRPAIPVQPETPPPASTSAPAEPPAPAPDDPKKDEAYWRTRITGARQALERSVLLRDALQSRVNALWTDFVARDDPAQRVVIASDRAKALAELARVEDEIRRQTAAISEIQEEARRAGVPPGWLR